MLFTNCHFLEGIDISDVVPFLDIDLEDALLSGVVPQSGVIPDYNGIEDSDGILGRVYDSFDAIEHQRNLNNAMNIYRSSLVANNTSQSTDSSAE